MILLVCKNLKIFCNKYFEVLHTSKIITILHEALRFQRDVYENAGSWCRLLNFDIRPVKFTNTAWKPQRCECMQPYKNFMLPIFTIPCMPCNENCAAKQEPEIQNGSLSEFLMILLVCKTLEIS